MPRQSLLGMIAVMAWTLGGSAADKPSVPPAASRDVDFVRDIQPMFRTRCYSCHDSAKQRGGLRLDVKSAALKGGESYAPVIVPGKSADSPLVRFVAGLENGMQMPPEGERLSAEQIGLLRAWIDQGAQWPDEAAGEEDASRHWSFRPLMRPNVPEVSRENVAWSRNPVDRFVISRLEQPLSPQSRDEGTRITPSAEADRVTLIRRLNFDLLGLPPTPEEVAEFVADARPDASERLVDRLLASPHFGERWARHWLDVVRFAESDGFETNQPRPNAWPYRDYVIRAFNEDIPFEQFVTEQLAGDTLGVDEATGFIVGGAWDRVKSPDPGLTAQQRADELHDMVSTTGSAFLGLTVGCARCHNHKFDPISQIDYYSLKAVFAGVQHGERPLPPTNSPQRDQQIALAKAELAEIERRLWSFEPIAIVRRGSPDPGQQRPAVHRRTNVDRFVPMTAKFVRFFVEQTNNGAQPCLDEVEIFTTEATPRNVARNARVSSSSSLPGYEIHQLKHVNDGRYGNSASWISNEAGRGWVQFEFPEPIEIDRVLWSRDRPENAQYNDRIPTKYRIEIAVAADAWQIVAGSDDRLPFDQKMTSQLPLRGLNEQEQAQAKDLAARQASLTEALRKLTALPQVYAGRFVAPEPTYRFHRGDPMQPKEPIAPAALASFGSAWTSPLDAPEASRRQALAKWITDPQHPLTSRVLVNRLWHFHFGQGLVTTPSDFGRNGARPSHPELLDWLGSEVFRGQYSVFSKTQSGAVSESDALTEYRLLNAEYSYPKRIHRLIVTSAAYRQSSAARADAMQADAGTRLLWRYPPRRLEAEPLRDAILAVCGNLDDRMGGPGFDLFEPNTNYVKVYNSKKEFGPADWRRMVYQSKPRMQLDDTFGQFDCPDAGQITPKRTSSITALQALNLLNSRFMVQQAALFANRLEREAGPDTKAQVRRAYSLAFLRRPTEDEHSSAVQFVEQHGLPAFCRALLNANEFLFVF